MAELLDDNHHCAWRVEAEALRIEVAELKAKVAALTAALEAFQRRVLGPKAEKLPSPEKELKAKASDEDAEARRLAALQRRRERAALREAVKAQTVIHQLSDDQRACPHCGGSADRKLGAGKQTFLY